MNFTNTATAIGDQLIVTPTPLLNYQQITGYQDEVFGETADAFFIRSFRVSLDGLLFGPWQPLTQQNLQAVVPSFTLYLQFRYERGGTDATGALTFNSLTLNGVLKTDAGDTLISRSIFREVDQVEQESVCVRLTRRFYDAGIVPQYIERDRGFTDNENALLDQDYVAFWRAVACFYAYVIMYVKRYERLYDRAGEILSEYLAQRDVVLSGNESDEDLQSLANQYWVQMRLRGTNAIAVAKGEPLATGAQQPVAGELLRLTDRRLNDEFVVETVPRSSVGFCLGKSSPMYRGFAGHRNALQKISWAVPGLLTAIEFASFVKSPSVTLQSGHVVFAPPLSPEQLTLASNQFLIAPGQDYEIDLVVSANVEPQHRLFVSANLFNAIGAQLQAQSLVDGTITNQFFPTGFSFARMNTDYLIRLSLRNRSFVSSPGLTIPSVNQGHNLRQIDEAVVRASISLSVQVTSFPTSQPAWQITVKDMAVRPLARPSSVGFLGSPQRYQIWSRYRNQSVSEEQALGLMKRKLLPYSTVPELFNVNV